jgi:branched-chain amino acid transport system substrate-binding protein
MEKKYLYLAIIGATGLIAVFFYPKVGTGQTVRIGASLPLFNSSYGSGCLSGIQLAEKEINDAGGINGRKLEMKVEDDKCDSREGVLAINKLLNIDNVTAMIGPLCSNVASSVIPTLQENKVPSLILASKAGLTTGKNYIFRISPSDDLQGSFAAEYIYNDLNKKKVAILYVNNDWGQGIHDIFVERFKELGGAITFDEGVAQGSPDLRSTLAKLNSFDAEVIYFPAYPIEFLTGLKQMKELGINKPIISGDAIEINDVLNSDLSEGVMYVMGKYNEPAEFKQKIKNSLNQESNFVSPMCYDAVMAIKNAIEKEGLNKEKIRDAVGSLNMAGVSRPMISFDQNGELNNSQLEIKIIKDKKSEVIKSE